MKQDFSDEIIVVKIGHFNLIGNFQNKEVVKRTLQAGIHKRWHLILKVQFVQWESSYFEAALVLYNIFGLKFTVRIFLLKVF